MSSVQFFRSNPWIIVLQLCAFLRWCEGAPVHQNEALQQLSQMNVTQANLIASNSTVKCSLTPNLCDWQLHLYEGHAFSVPLAQTMESTTTRAPPLPTAGQKMFELNHKVSGAQLFILAEIEPKSRRRLRRKRKLWRRATFNHSSKQKFILLVVQ
ncbi:uncharacterized protein LOC26526045 [Drosophila erecta]|uniref:Uncharacterized protein n=1 Tax=Drosophila erecta TaxID=7220 RepID=A0A0Q5VVB0_DROER|nr:uncharacterized protein LOC26526045 [Drosophila erecta]KQS62233.1 uncharacterized protein Dere_GG26221 [Drosophila erecta]